jgi:hypothetical protein
MGNRNNDQVEQNIVIYRGRADLNYLRMPRQLTLRKFRKASSHCMFTKIEGNAHAQSIICKQSLYQSGIPNGLWNFQKKFLSDYNSTVFNTESVILQTFLTNPSKLRIYLCKIPTVITETIDNSPYRLIFYLDKFRQKKTNFRKEPFKSRKIPKFG